MVGFKKYQHVERLGTDEVEGIECGECVIMPKIDGTNSSIWLDDNGNICCGSRNRELSLDKDNAGFMEYILNNDKFKLYLEKHPNHRLYGEWLVPHSLKTYKDDAWKKFYVFDITVDNEDGGFEYIPYQVYKPLLDEFEIDYIEPLAIVNNPDILSFYDYLDKNDFLIKEGTGEGIVIHNYGFYNKYGRQTWAKIVTAEFKKVHKSNKEVKGVAPIELLEGQIVDNYVTSALVEKEYSKIVTANEGWNSKLIPMLLNTVYHTLITEEMWNIVKKYKNPKIDFRVLQNLCYSKVKQIKQDLF